MLFCQIPLLLTGPVPRDKVNISVNDRQIEIDFNECACINLFDLDQFEERIYMIMEGQISSTDSKKCKKNMAALVIMHYKDIWYDKRRLREDLNAIEDMEIITAKAEIKNEDNPIPWV